jgi:hypothetical protein
VLGGLDLAEYGKDHHPLGIDGEAAGHLSLAEDDDLQHVPGADLVVGGGEGRAGDRQESAERPGSRRVSAHEPIVATAADGVNAPAARRQPTGTPAAGGCTSR